MVFARDESMKLHNYQQECIDILREFFKNAENSSPKSAFMEMTDCTYRFAPKMSEQMPFVCLRIPTGGGKTLVAAHAAVVAAKDYLHDDAPVFLWVAPSNAIVEQTLKSFRNREHPCRKVLAESFNSVNCLSIDEAFRANKHDMDSGATVIVTTWQSFNIRADKQDKRKVYDENGDLMPHFDNIPGKFRGMVQDKDGEIVYSLVNALKLKCPIIIEDEAHNARGEQFYESLANFNPVCFLEFTATPETNHNPAINRYGSNILFRVSARELKEAGMIKMPINLETVADWQENIRTAVTKREELEKEAKKLSEYIRPIVLYQAQSKGRGNEATVEVIREILINNFHIPEEQIAVYTSGKKELKDIDLLSDKCQLRHIITVRALAEGWDCSFAYILCTMANSQTSNPVEQILGRILRLPRATPTSIDKLNESYAYSSGGDFYNVARSLKDALVKGAGFQEDEAADFIKKHSNESGPLFVQNNEIANRKLPKDIKPSPVPFLAVSENGKLQFLEPIHCLDVSWNIAKEEPDVSAFEQMINFVRSEKGKLDIDESDKIKIFHSYIIGKREQKMLLEADKKWTNEALVAWLDNSFKHLDIVQRQTTPYILAAIRQLRERYELPELVRYRYYIKTVIENAIAKLRQKEYKKGYQSILDGIGEQQLKVSDEYAFDFNRQLYKTRWNCENIVSFGKHFFPEVGELKDEGEEWECAKHINDMEEVEMWVRNLDKRGFSLTTSTGAFYPDFVCWLKDGRILIVEYKGRHLEGNARTVETEQVGKVWAELSGGKCVFVMSKDRNFQAINNAIARN